MSVLGGPLIDVYNFTVTFMCDPNLNVTSVANRCTVHDTEQAHFFHHGQQFLARAKNQ